MKKKLTKLQGETEDGKTVIGGIFNYCSTYGAPLELVIDEFDKNDFVIDWKDFVCSAISSGMDKERVKSRIIEAVSDIKGTKYTKEFKKRLELLNAEM